MNENSNITYIVCFLKNGGEKTRAVKLVKDFYNLDLKSAINYVEGLKMPLPMAANRESKMYCPECRNEWEIETKKCPLCENSKLKVISPANGAKAKEKSKSSINYES